MNKKSLSAAAKIRIHRPPSIVFKAFVDAGSMSKFWFNRKDEGLQEGKSCTWFIGSAKDAFSFDIFVKEISHPNKLAFLWERDGVFTQVTWTFDETEDGDTLLKIEESGFKGDRDAIFEQVLDSTGGFNQVIVAAKAYIEHGVEVNVVADHV